MGGFVAATYMRGIPFIQVPTTLLAMVDSSIGGKTGVDTPSGKNLVGAFHHPLLVCIDPEFLTTLDSRQYFNGFAEIIKTAAIRDISLFQLLESNARVLAAREDETLLEQVILRTAGNKAYVVSIDSTEQGVRSTLNFGHTIGHAIEALVFPDLLHGECVSIGMVLETKLSNFMGHLESSSTVGRLLRCLQAYKLPVTIPSHLDFSRLLEKMLVDKKNAASKIRCTIVRGIGNTFETPLPVAEDLLRMVIQPSIIVEPQLKPLEGKIIVPGSKSLSNRILTLAALGEGKCRIKGLLHADDTQHMLDALEQLGVQMQWDSSGEVLEVVGSGGVLKEPTKPLYLGNAGTASRFLTSVCALLPSGASAVLTGTNRLKERPIEDLTNALIANGCKIEFLEKENHFPFRIHGGGLAGGTVRLAPEVSSQFVSSILLSAPYARQPVRLELTGKAVSQPFIDMTVKIMEPFGIRGGFSEGAYFVPCGVYRNSENFVVEADASSASYPLSIAAITGGEVTVLNVGSDSLQGDSRFALDVLKPMGCEVTQSSTSTTVKGPQGLKLKAINVDMEPLTDTFMTAAVLMAVAEGTSRITGIANQRVKECNRIAAMVAEFAKIGVVARELPDGLEIDGCAGDLSKLKTSTAVSIHCYNDHRIAMSFAVLSCVLPGLVIEDKECVDKTYPEFWVAMRNYLGMSIRPAPPVAADKQRRQFEPSTTVVLVGMRGSGKSTMGAALATHLKRQFYDMDSLFESKHGKISEYVAQNGWPAFRQLESRMLFDLVRANPHNTVISTGGGIVETAEAVSNLKNTGALVVQLVRPFEDVKATLAGDSTRAVLGEPIESVWARRKPLYQRCSHIEFSIASQPDWVATELNFVNFVTRVLSGERYQPAEPSFFLCLTKKTVTEPLPPQIFEVRRQRSEYLKGNTCSLFLLHH